VLIDIYRRMSIADKWRTINDLYRTGRLLHAAGYRQRSGDASATDVVNDWMEFTLEPNLLRKLRQTPDGAIS
jgi:hypothetical protein